MLRVIGLIAALTALMVGIGANLPLFLDPPSVLIVIGGAISMLLIGGHSIPTMFRAVFSGEATIAELRTAARAWRMVRWYLVAAGFTGSLIGLVILIANLDDPAAIGPGTALSMLTVFYAVFLAFFIALPLQSRLEERIEEEGGQA